MPQSACYQYRNPVQVVAAWLVQHVQDPKLLSPGIHLECTTVEANSHVFKSLYGLSHLESDTKGSFFPIAYRVDVVAPVLQSAK